MAEHRPEACESCAPYVGSEPYTRGRATAEAMYRHVWVAQPDRPGHHPPPLWWRPADNALEDP